MQRCQCTAAYQHCNETAEAQREIRARQLPLGPLCAKNDPAEIKHHNGKQIGRPAKKIEQQIRDQRAKTAHTIADIVGRAGLTESWIGRVISKQRIPEDQRQRAKHPQRALAQGIDYLSRQPGSRFYRLSGFRHIKVSWKILLLRY